MTLDEAIKRSEEVAEEHTRYNRYGGFESWNEVNCTECAKEHRQLANWLKELKQLREQEPCEDAISRRAVLDTLDKMDSVLDEDRTVETYKELLAACYKDLPPVTPAHKTGKWIYSGSYDVEGVLYCSNCKHEIDVSEGYFKFCPNCGAEMESEE